MALEKIRDYWRISERITTAGQPTIEELNEVVEAGFEAVINLLPTEHGEGLANENQLVAERGLFYCNIPVLWEEPTEENLRLFFGVMEAWREKRLFIHCAANRRVSVFMYLYRTQIEGVPEQEAARDLYAIWTPNPIWQAFLESRRADEK